LNGYVIHSGDKLFYSQWQSTNARAGMAFWFTDGTTSHWTTYDQNGQPMNEDGAGYAQAWQDRRVDLSQWAGKTISLTALLTDSDTLDGDWTVY